MATTYAEKQLSTLGIALTLTLSTVIRNTGKKDLADCNDGARTLVPVRSVVADRAATAAASWPTVGSRPKTPAGHYE